jgi:hypothetical protein
MYHSREDFIREIVKVAQDTSVGDDEDQVVKGQQSDETPELLQPDEGPGEGPRGEEEAMSTGGEKEHQENREGGYLQNAFSGFNAAARQDGQQLKSLLSNFGPKAIVSRATPEAGATKIGHVQLTAFSDELNKISSWGSGVLKKLKGEGMKKFPWQKKRLSELGKKALK